MTGRISVALKCCDYVRESGNAPRPRQLKRSFQFGHSSIHALSISGIQGASEAAVVPVSASKQPAGRLGGRSIDLRRVPIRRQRPPTSCVEGFVRKFRGLTARASGVASKVGASLAERGSRPGSNHWNRCQSGARKIWPSVDRFARGPRNNRCIWMVSFAHLRDLRRSADCGSD